QGRVPLRGRGRRALRPVALRPLRRLPARVERVAQDVLQGQANVLELLPDRVPAAARAASAQGGGQPLEGALQRGVGVPADEQLDDLLSTDVVVSEAPPR